MSWLRGLIAGGVRNPVFVNLLMVCMLAGGVLSARRMVRESFPQFSLDHIAVEVVYPGASPRDVERAICTPIEEVLEGIPGVREISSAAQENRGTVWVGLRDEVDEPQRVVDEIRNRVDKITTFPAAAERPVVYETLVRTPVINIAIYGDTLERTLKAFGEEVQTELTARQAISQVSLSGVRDEEIIIEVSRDALQGYGLSLEQIMGTVARSSLDLPAGVIRTADEEFTLRVTGQRFSAREYENLTVIEHDDAVVHLGDLASVREGFAEEVVRGRFNGQSAVVVQIFKTPDEDATEIARVVRDYVAARQPYLPDRIRMSVWADMSDDIDSRIAMLVENGAIGIVLVFMTLLLFLDLRTAFWVSIGIPVAFGGALILIHMQGQTLNLMSLFALIMVSGIIVDDAIVVAESIHARRREGLEPRAGAVEGTHRMALPVLGSSLTTIVAFVPLLFVVGVMGRFIYVLPVVVIAAIVSSAVEAFGILPTHLCRHEVPGVERTYAPGRLRRALDAGMEGFIERYYRPVYHFALRYRFVTVAVALSGCVVVGGLVWGGRTPFVLLPDEDSNILRARVRFPDGTPESVTQRAMDHVEEAAIALNEDPTLQPASGDVLVRQRYAILGEFADIDVMSERGNNLMEVQIELTPAEERRVKDDRIIERWRDKIGAIPDATQVLVGRLQTGPLTVPLEIRLLGHDLEALADASERFQAHLARYDGLYDIRDDLIPGKREIRVTLKPTAPALGLTLEDVGRQLRNGFFGGEAIRLQRGDDLVKVRVRFPEDERRSITDLETLHIRTPAGGAVPFLEVADAQWGRGYAFVMHQDGRRRVRVSAAVDDRVGNAEAVVQALESGFLPELVRSYNDVTYEIGGNRARLRESLDSLTRGFTMAVIVIYALLAGMLRSYVQPLVILTAVPLGLVGVVVGHAVLGFDLTIMSLFGAVALAGVVVNDSLVLLDGVNRGVREGLSLPASVRAAGEDRFRAVVLTSMTTVAGLLPILLERSSQAQMVKPMAISLGAGLIFATVLSLVVVPSLYLILNDLRRLIHWLRYGGGYPQPELVEEAARERYLATG